MNRRIRIGFLLAAVVMVSGFIAIRATRDDGLPVKGPIPPSTVPSTSADLDALQLRLTPVASVSSPTAFAIRPGDSSFYVTEQEGRVRRIRDTNGSRTLDDEPVLDITSDVIANGEQGLLGLAFSSDGRKMYVAFTNRHSDQQLDELTFGGNSDGNTNGNGGADRIDTRSRRTLLVIPDFAPN